MSRKVVKLQLEHDFEFLLFGLVSTAKDYRLCFQINKLFELDLCKEMDIELKINNAGFVDFFSFYEFINEDHEEFILISNKGKSTSLVPEYKQLDYFFMIKNQVIKSSGNEIIEKFKKSPLILGIYQINASKLKSRENLLF